VPLLTAVLHRDQDTWDTMWSAGSCPGIERAHRARGHSLVPSYLRYYSIHQPLLISDPLSQDEDAKENSEAGEGIIEQYELLEKVMEFCMSKDFEGQFDDFAAEHAELFIPVVGVATADIEHKLEFHDCYTGYLEHFEGRIKKYIERIGEGTVEEFYDQCSDALDHLPEFHPKRFFIEALLATTEYPIFLTLMVGEARKIGEKADADAEEGGHK